MICNILLPPIYYWPIFRYIPPYLFWPVVILVIGLVIYLLVKGVTALTNDFSAGMVIIGLAFVFLVASILIVINVDAIMGFIRRVMGPLFGF